MAKAWRQPDRGIIPACAGSAPGRPPTRRAGRDHPRVRGEHSRNPYLVYINRGSSPRARGALGEPHRGGLHVGIIPACAGSTPGGRPAAALARDHPRVRGEHSKAADKPNGIEGSSPRARGARRHPAGDSHPRGIIPACAGSTHLTDVASVQGGDHPRVRGEHLHRVHDRGRHRGSSPRARGAPPLETYSKPNLGIIPACAGSTPVGSSRITCERDHPRVRGEHSSTAARRCATSGSSPRARGAQPVVDLFDPFAGIIPACAGSTARRQHDPGRSRGSSPRARGAQPVVDLFDPFAGIIPACAGSTARRQHDPGRSRGSSPRARGAPRAG